MEPNLLPSGTRKRKTKELSITGLFVTAAGLSAPDQLDVSLWLNLNENQFRGRHMGRTKKSLASNRNVLTVFPQWYSQSWQALAWEFHLFWSCNFPSVFF